MPVNPTGLEDLMRHHLMSLRILRRTLLECNDPNCESCMHVDIAPALGERIPTLDDDTTAAEIYDRARKAPESSATIAAPPNREKELPNTSISTLACCRQPKRGEGVNQMSLVEILTLTAEPGPSEVPSKPTRTRRRKGPKTTTEVKKRRSRRLDPPEDDES